jgi:hypothetical protein
MARIVENDDEPLLTSQEESINASSASAKSLKEFFSFLAIQFAVECVLLVAYCFAFSYVLTLPYCGFLFQCGCTWFWKGGINKYVFIIALPCFPSVGAISSNRTNHTVRGASPMPSFPTCHSGALLS